MSAPREQIGTISKSPLPQIDVGANLQPLVMIRSKLDEDMLERFLKEHLYSCNEEELNSYPGLENQVAKPVYVYEGYYHSMATSETV